MMQGSLPILSDSGDKTLGWNYRWYLIGNFSSSIGLWVQRTAILWLTWELTHSTSWLGVIAIAETGPTIALGLYAGAVLDRLNHLRVLRFTQFLTLLYSITLFAVMASGYMTIWILAGLVLFRGSVFAFNRPARQTVVYSLVGREQLLKALAQNATIFQTSKFIGPAIAGTTLVALGVSGTFAIAVLLILVFTGALRLIEVPAPDRKNREPRPIVAEVADGLRYILSQPAVRNQFLLLLVVALCAKPITELMPGFASGEFNRAATGLAWLLGCHGAGASLAGAWISFRFGAQSLQTLACVAIISMAIALILFVGLNAFVVGCVIMFFFGFSSVMMDISNQTLIQSAIRSRFRGRTMSIYGMIAQGSPAVGALAMGTIAEATGLRWPVFVGACIALIAGILALAFHTRIAAPSPPDEKI
jgi:predicted MFS family arabinose efflux permease